MGRGDTFHFYAYNSDNANKYAVKLSDTVAQQGGFAERYDPIANAVWPFGKRSMRHVYGKAANGARAQLPIGGVVNLLYQSGGTFTLGNVQYTVEGAIGEKRRLNHIA